MQLGDALGTEIAALAASFVILAPFVGLAVATGGCVAARGARGPADRALGRAPGGVLPRTRHRGGRRRATLLAFGRPDQHPSPATVAASLGAAGLVAADLGPSPVSRRGSRNFLATLTDGGQLLAKVRSPAERSADLLFRFYRYLRLKNVGDERPFISLRRAVEHEALVSLQARDAGVRTPRLRAIAEVGTDSMLLAFDHVDGRTLDAVDGDEIDDTLLESLWEQIVVLRARRIAHRDLRRSNVVIDASGRALDRRLRVQ